jgi:hypothetical protein
VNSGNIITPIAERIAAKTFPVGVTGFIGAPIVVNSRAHHHKEVK